MSTVTPQPAQEVAVEADLENAVVPVIPTDSLTPVFTNPADWFVPAFPEKLEDLDVSPGFLTELALKTVPLDADCTTATIAARMRLGLLITEALLQRLCHEKFIEIKGIVGLRNHRYAMLDHGWGELQRLTSFCSYAGPAPVSLKSYAEMITQQVRNRPPSSRQALDQAMSNLILSDYAKEILGLVVGSGRSLFLTGPSGNGKTAAFVKFGMPVDLRQPDEREDQSEDVEWTSAAARQRQNAKNQSCRCKGIGFGQLARR